MPQHLHGTSIQLFTFIAAWIVVRMTVTFFAARRPDNPAAKAAAVVF